MGALHKKNVFPFRNHFGLIHDLTTILSLIWKKVYTTLKSASKCNLQFWNIIAEFVSEVEKTLCNSKVERLSLLAYQMIRTCLQINQANLISSNSDFVAPMQIIFFNQTLSK